MDRWQRAPDVLWRSTSRGPVILSPAMEMPNQLAGLGAFVWELLEGPMTRDELRAAIDELAPHGEAPSDASLAEAVQLLLERDLVQEAAS